MASIRTNHQYDDIRSNLEARNLYNPDHPYQIQNPKLVTAINSIASLIPGKSINITNTPYGRLLGVGAQTPITIIGAEMYARNIAQSVTSFAISDSTPSVNFRNLFDGNPNTKLLTKKEDYRITRDETKSTIGKLLQDITNQQPKLANTVFTGSGNLAPFDKFPNQFDYIRNTGKGQLNQYYANIGRNLYIQSSNDFIEVAKNQGYKVDKVTKTLLNSTYFPTNDPDNFPDGQAASDDVRSEIVFFREDRTEERVSEYGSNVVKNAMGNTTKKILPNTAQNLPNQEQDIDFEFTDESYGFKENIDDQIVWGRDNTDTLKAKYGVRSGALLYTKGLLQARGSRAYFDQTKQKYINRDGSIMYNGSPLTRHIDGTVDRSRQHTILDPYNNYAKAIRFTGNSVYNAPAESVINKTIIPKMHPILDTSNRLNNENMMFSIENLAYILNDKGYIGDGHGTKVPESEVGVNRGRLMWFAPYDVVVTETASAKYESTQFIGRSEPVYSYQSSERSARLSFKLIIDYPPQIDGMSHGDAAKFITFGGQFNDTLKNIDIDKERANLKDLELQLSLIQPEEVLAPPTDLKSGDVATFYFHNDGDSVTDDIKNGYENGIFSATTEVNDNGLNSAFRIDVFTLVNEILSKEYFPYYNISFLGSASRLYFNKKTEKTYNKALGLRRAKSLREYVENKFKQYKGLTFEKAGINVKEDTIGSSKGSDEGVLETNISLLKVKEERYAVVRLTTNGTLQKKKGSLTTSQIQDKIKLEEEIGKKKELLAAAAKAQSNERVFNQVKIGDRVFKGFEAMRKITLSPVFHSQTPEDFHRRLTFLHQCTRQGNAVQNKATSDAGIAVPRNSVFGRPPICVLRLGDMFHSKVVIETIDFDFTESIWDINPEGMGMQFMIANIDISMKIIGGQSLKGAIDVIQNAESFNYYANSTFYKSGVYQFARKVENAQVEADYTTTNFKGQARFGAGVGSKLQAEGNDI